MRVTFRTNLDAAKSDVNALNSRALGRVPRKGELIRFSFFRGQETAANEYHLEVCSVVYDYAEHLVEVELHIPSYFVADKSTIAGWSKWFRQHRGVTP